MWLGLYALAGLMLLAALFERSLAGPVGVSLLDSIKVMVVFAMFAVLPGYVLLRAMGCGRGHWIDWLAPSFCASLVALCVFSVPAYIIGLPLWSVALFMGLVALAGAVVWFFRRPAGDEESPVFFGEDSRTLGPRVAGVVVLLLMALTAYHSLRPFSRGSDLWFHSGFITKMALAGQASMSDPFHATSAPHPMYFMNLWHLLLAGVSYLAHVEIIDVVRIVPIMLVPIVTSAWACLSKAFFTERRPRFLGLGVFLSYLTFFATSMEASPDPSMWRQFSIPRWVALFAVYPMTLGLGVRWVARGSWRLALGAGAVAGMAMFLHPQGGQYYVMASGAMLLGGAVFRQWRWTGRAALALALCAPFVAVFFLLRHQFLESAISGSKDFSIVSVEALPSRSALGAMFADRLGNLEFSRAVVLHCSPLFFLAVAALPLWWRDQQEEHRLLLATLVPALALPALPFLKMLPIAVSDGIVYRGTWAAPVLAASGLSLGLLSWRRVRSLRALDWVFVAVMVGLLVIVHMWPRRGFESWWWGESLLALIALPLVLLAIWPGRGQASHLRWLRATPAFALGGLLVYFSLNPRYRREEADLAARRNSVATKQLAGARADGGYVLADSISSCQLSTLAGCRILGGNKAAIYYFRDDHRAMHEAMLRLLENRQSLGHFVATLRKYDVRWIYLFPKRHRSLVERLDALPGLFDLRAEDLGIRLYRLDVSEQQCRSEAGRLTSRSARVSGTTVLELLRMARELDPELDQVKEGISKVERNMAERKRELLSALKRNGGPTLKDLDQAAREYSMEPELLAAKAEAAEKLIAAGHLVRGKLDAGKEDLEALRAPRDGKAKRSGLKRPLPMTWTGVSENCCAVRLKPPRLIHSLSIAVVAGRRKQPDRIRAILRGAKGDSISVDFRKHASEKNGKIVEYVAGPIVLYADCVELRFFSGKANGMRLREFKLQILEEANKTK